MSYTLKSMVQLLLAVVRSNLHKGIILLSKVSIIVYKAGKRTGVENSDLSVGTYSIDNFKTKIRAAILQQRQDWEPPQMKDLKLVIPEHYTFMANNTTFIGLGIPNKYLEKTMLIRSTLAPGSYITSPKIIVTAL